jgi:hypothetical protein
MANVMKVLRDERKMLSKRLSALDTAIAALSGNGTTGQKTPKKHGRVWTPAMRRAAAKRAKARWAKTKKG